MQQYTSLQNYFKIDCHVSKAFIPVSNVRKPDASKNCFVKTSDIVINPLSEYLNNDISPCGKKSCQTCNQFVSD